MLPKIWFSKDTQPCRLYILLQLPSGKNLSASYMTANITNLGYISISVSVVYSSTSETNSQEAVKCYKYSIYNHVLFQSLLVKLHFKETFQQAEL